MKCKLWKLALLFVLVGGWTISLHVGAGQSSDPAKVVPQEKEQGLETHRISRVTTVSWQDKEGQERFLQFVSLQGHHRRQP
jgi:hypothetical protein